MTKKKDQNKSGNRGKSIGKVDRSGGSDEFSEHHDRSQSISNTAPPPPRRKPSPDTSDNDD